MGTATDDKKLYAYEPDHASPPGENLAEILELKDMTQAELATRTGLSPKHVNQIIKGVAPITPETALALEKVTGVPARIWNALEATFRSLVSRKEEEEDLQADVDWLEEVPYRELVKREYVSAKPTAVERVRELCRFFGVANRSAWKTLWTQTAYRKSKAFESNPGAISTWLRIGELEASMIDCAPFDRVKLEAALQEARSMTRLQDPSIWFPKLQALFAEAGVALVVVPEIGKTRVYGACRWLSSDKALIQLSVRQKWADIFWFALFHEAGHLLKHGKKDMFIKEESSTEQHEEEADTFASRWLIPKQYGSELSGLSLSDVRGFAHKLGVGTDIVVGRLQHDGKLKPHEGRREFQRLLDPEGMAELSRRHRTGVLGSA